MRAQRSSINQNRCSNITRTVARDAARQGGLRAKRAADRADGAQRRKCAISPLSNRFRWFVTLTLDRERIDPGMTSASSQRN